MRVPQISDRVKEAPATALRGFLAGVGQLLLVTDRLRNKNSASPEATADAEATVESPAETVATTVPEAPVEAPVEEAAPAEAAPASAAAEAPSEAAETAGAAEAAPKKRAPRKRDPNKTGNVRLLTGEDAKAAEPVATAAEAPAPEPAAQTGLPLANYDDLSVASLRARLRNLTAGQVAELAGYERGHAARPEVISMFERRIAKLEAGG